MPRSSSDPSPILELLLELDYTDDAIRGALEYVAVFGSAQGNPHVDREHREMVESLLGGDGTGDDHDGGGA